MNKAGEGPLTTNPRLVIPTDNRILYFGRDRAVFGFLSHFHSASILLDEEVWPTVEHY